MKTLVIVPAFNEGSVIAQTLHELQSYVKEMEGDILVVDDGSRDDTYRAARDTGVKVIRHRLNRGLGGAIGTGLEYAKRYGYDRAITLDADGQHHPSDMKKVIKPIQQDEADVVIGSRFKYQNSGMPYDRKIILRLSNFLTYVLFGQKTSDSLSGFRAFNYQAIQRISIRTERMEVSNEIFGEIKRNNLRMKEVPIRVIYTEYSRSKGQSNSNALNVIFKLFLVLFRNQF